MVKKRNCQRTDIEKANHKLVVALKRMTDKQLIEYMEQLKATASAQTLAFLKDKLLTELSLTRGVGKNMLSKISKAIDAL